MRDKRLGRCEANHNLCAHVQAFPFFHKTHMNRLIEDASSSQIGVLATSQDGCAYTLFYIVQTSLDALVYIFVERQGVFHAILDGVAYYIDVVQLGLSFACLSSPINHTLKQKSLCHFKMAVSA